MRSIRDIQADYPSGRYGIISRDIHDLCQRVIELEEEKDVPCDTCNERASATGSLHCGRCLEEKIRELNAKVYAMRMAEKAGK